MTSYLRQGIAKLACVPSDELNALLLANEKTHPLPKSIIPEKKTTEEPPKLSFPAVLERTHFVVLPKTDLSQLFDMITKSAFLPNSKVLKVDAVVNPSKTYYTVYPSDQDIIEFVVKVFQNDKKRIIEFQRRSGDLLLFSDIFYASGLMLKGLVEETKINPRPKLPTLPKLEITDEEVNESINCLLEMANADYDDTRIQALYALFRMAHDKRNHSCLIKSDALLIFIRAAESENSYQYAARYALDCLWS